MNVARVRRARSAIRVWLLAVGFIAAFALATGPALAEDVPISAFYGTYEGTAVFTGDDTQHTRKITVTIAPENNGFNVSWDTVKVYPGGHTNPKRYSIDFESTQRKQVFGSQMRRNMFGDRVPLNPLAGEPYFWARIVDKTLTVYALHILESGSFEMQIYHRTLVEDGLSTEFIRFSETTPVRIVRGTLKRVAE